jgi:competence protein ComEC
MDNRRGGRATTWPPEARGRAWAGPWRLSGLADGARTQFDRCLATDFAPGRPILWLPVAFGIGIILYFTAAHEPFWWASLALTVGFGAAGFALRASIVGFPAMLGLAAIAAGFTVATLKTHVISHPVLSTPVFSAQLSGFVEMREERERSDRIVLRVHRMDGGRVAEKLERVRLSVRKGTAPAIGSFVELRARLNPPLAPLRPSGYDFARDMYFQRIGASGFVLGQIRQATPPEPPSLRLRYAAAIASLRDGIDARIRAALPGDKGAIASALITGKRDAISAPVNEAMYISSLGHVLSISGYHMAVVAGVVFFTIRAGLALIPAFATRHPIKKWAALCALGMAAFYLLLSGAEVATQRAFIMTAIVLIGVMCDRPALTLRTIAVAALAVLLIAPQAIVHPSFQMSFAATLALIAAYERGLPWLSTVPETSLGARIALWGGREILGLVLASLVAGLATTLFAAYHFHRLAPYGLLSNLLAMPIVSAWVMPSGLLALAAMPFGFDATFWHLMGGGIDWMIAVALWVARLPGAVGRVHAFGVGPLLLASFGLVLICLLRSPLRFAGALLIGVACLAAWSATLPDVRVSHDARMVAVRGPDDRLSLMTTASDDFTLREWLAADADARGARDDTLSVHVRCDDLGCTAPLRGGGVVALAQSAEALADDCNRAVVVVTQRQAPSHCKAQVIDRDTWRRHGAASLTRAGDRFEIIFARPPGYDRPWAKSLVPSGDDTRASPAARAPARDATPRSEDMEAGD